MGLWNWVVCVSQIKDVDIDFLQIYFWKDAFMRYIGWYMAFNFVLLSSQKKKMVLLSRGGN